MSFNKKSFVINVIYFAISFRTELVHFKTFSLPQHLNISYREKDIFVLLFYNFSLDTKYGLIR